MITPQCLSGDDASECPSDLVQTIFRDSSSSCYSFCGYNFLFGSHHLKYYDTQYKTCAAVIRDFRCCPYYMFIEEMIRTISMCAHLLYFTTPLHWCVLYFIIVIIIGLFYFFKLSYLLVHIREIQTWEMCTQYKYVQLPLFFSPAKLPPCTVNRLLCSDAFAMQYPPVGFTKVTVSHTHVHCICANRNEREGIPVEIIHLLDTCVEIPQFGVIRSLNVHVSGAVLVWEYTKQHCLPNNH